MRFLTALVTGILFAILITLANGHESRFSSVQSVASDITNELNYMVGGQNKAKPSLPSADSEIKSIRRFWNSDRAKSIRAKFGSYLERVFEGFVTRYQKHYNQSELPQRMLNFFRRKQQVEKWNKDRRATFSIKVNRFADLTDAELISMNKLQTPNEVRRKLTSDRLMTKNTIRGDDFWENYQRKVNLPSSKSWVSFFPPVRDQESCGSCYAFATVDAVMAQKHIHWNFTSSLAYSPQQIVDCSYRDNGCNGGWPERTLNYIKDSDGIACDMDYPYKARRGICQVRKGSNPNFYLFLKSASIQGPYFKQLHTEDQFMQHIAHEGPVIAAMYASPLSHYYSGGVFEDHSCFGRLWNHAVIVVGYGTEGGIDYWLIRNSWGTEWGDSGYMKLVRGKHACQIGKMGWGITKTASDN